MSVSTQPLQKRRWWDDEKDIELNEKVWRQIKANDPSISCLLVREYNPFLQRVMWRNENDAFSSNTNLKRITIYGSSETMTTMQQVDEWAASLTNPEQCAKHRKAEDLRGFCKALSNNGSIDHLILRGWDTYNVSTEQHDKTDCPILPIIEYCYSLRRLVFVKCNMGKRNWARLAHALNRFAKDYSLEHLLLSENDIYHKEGRAIVSSCIQHPNLDKFALALSSTMRKTRGGPGLRDGIIYRNLIHSPASKLRFLNLQYNRLNDNSIESLSKSLAGNKTLKTLNLRGNKTITPSGWSVFLTNLSYSSDSGLTELDLSSNNINDKGIAALGKLLTRNNTTISLNLYSNEKVTERGWEEFASSGQNITLEHLNLSNNSLGKNGLISLGNMLKKNTVIKSLSLDRNPLLPAPDPTAWQPFFLAICKPKSTLERLDLANNGFKDEAVVFLGEWMASNTTLKYLNLDSSIGISSNGLSDFFNRLQNHPNPVLEELQITFWNLSITDTLVGSLVSSLMGMHSLKKIGIRCMERIYTQGWQSIATLLQHQNFMLTKLDFRGSYGLDDESLLTIANALVGNSILCELLLDMCRGITEPGWSALTNVLCNKSSIDATYASNHTLQRVVSRAREESTCPIWRRIYSYEFPQDLRSVLQINRRGTKAQAAREKIIWYHMLKDDVVNVEAFLDMEQKELPSAISWLGRDDIGLSVLYKLCKSLPDLFESKMNMNNKKKRAKRKRIDYLTLLEDV